MIRKYTHADAPALIELLRLNTPPYFAATEEADYVQYLQQDATDYYVVERDNRVAGAGGINYFDKEKTAYISWDIFHPDAQGKGLGSRLTTFRIDSIKAMHKANVIVVRTSQLACGFYAKHGFKLVKTVNDYWAPGFDLYHMELAIE